MVLPKCLLEATEWIHSNWEKIPHGEDPTPTDIIYLAATIQEYCGLSIGKFNLTSDEADEILKEVGTYLLGGTRVAARSSTAVVRERSLKTLREELGSLISLLKAFPAVVAKMGGNEEALMKALYMYGSFLAIAKSCQADDTATSKINNEASLSLHRALVEKGRDNPWIISGITLVRVLKPVEPLIDEWIPKNSPYWDNF
jgi:hypothetical protein